MKKVLVVIILLLVASLVFVLLTKLQVRNKVENTEDIPIVTVENPEIIVDSPKPNDVVSSPLVVKGRARGTWYFEGQFPITLYYGVQDAFVNVNAFAIGEWMTEDYVDFEVIINFPVPLENDGLLVLSKDNPSDLRELDKSLSIPLRFHE